MEAMCSEQGDGKKENRKPAAILLICAMLCSQPGELLSASLRYGLVPRGTAVTIFTWRTANNMLHIKELATTDPQPLHSKTINLISS